MFRKSWWFFFIFSSALVMVYSFTPKKKDAKDPNALFQQYCSLCHMLPDPTDLTKKAWKEGVLPVMAANLGIEYPGYDPFGRMNSDEIELVKKRQYFPVTPLISQADWDKIEKYILQHAPENVIQDNSRLYRDDDLKQFVRKDIQLYDKPGSMITGLKFDPASKKLWIGDYNKTVITWQWGKGILDAIPSLSPVVDFDFHGGTTYFTEIGKLYPTELSTGSFAQYNDNAETQLLTSLHRPVHGEVCDLDNDGVPEIVVANFGNKYGSLSMYKKDKTTNKYVEHVLLGMPGAVKFYIMDMDGDGKKDIVALFAQGDESVYIFYQKENLQFSAQRVLRFPPDYGTTDFIIVDYNHDGHPDIVTANGDNADYSDILKKFHGIRININDGHNQFKEEFFYPIYGATRVIADDFDQDGDIDFAVTAFFPAFGPLVNESFVYLENENSEKYRFKSFILKSGIPVKSLTMEKADIDSDGDMDIILGMFSHSPGPVPEEIQDKWNNANYDLTIFVNQLQKKKTRAK